MNTKRTYIALLATSSAFLILGCASPVEGIAWTCSAPGLVSAKYEGSEYANIHLQGFSSGGNYKVKLNEQRTQATGVTANGTTFTCVKAK